MSKKIKSKKKTSSVKPKRIISPKTLKNSLISILFLAIIIGSFYFYTDIKKPEYDLSVIGNGTATVVQIHDPNCQLCRRLRSNVDSVKEEFTKKIQFKTANIASPKGRSFASKHQVPHVTLLFFDKKGRKVNTLQGVTSKENIKAALAQLLKRR